MRSKSGIAINGMPAFCIRAETHRNVHLDVLNTSHCFRSAINRLEKETHPPLISSETLSRISNVPLPTPSMEHQGEPTQGMKAECEV
jgi:hypothetical protein